MAFSLETIVAWAKRRGFAYPGSEIYGGLANARDLGPYGAQLRKNIVDIWRKYFIQEREDMVGLDAAILMNPKVWEASGHIAGFSDPLVDCKKCKARERADKLIEDSLLNIKASIPQLVKIIYKIIQDKSFQRDKDIEDVDTLLDAVYYTEDKWGKEKSLELYSQYRKEIDDCLDNAKKQQETIKSALDVLEVDNDEEFMLKFLKIFYFLQMDNLQPESRTFEQQTNFLNKFAVKCPECGASDWTEPKKFNLMFKTQQGVIDGEGKDIYLRPETAQGIFVNFKNILDTTRVRVPFGIGQIGKSFRNEITPGNFMYRVREFEQMEIEYFVEDDVKVGLKWLQDWKEMSEQWRIEQIGIKKEKLRFREHDPKELAFYSKGTWDVEYDFPRGWGELQGIAYRTDYDLKQHQEFSGKDLQYTDPMTGRRYLPHCIEPSWGLTRAILTAMIDAYDEEEYTNQKGEKETRVVVRFHKNIAPVKYAILPLVKKDEVQVKLAEELFRKLSKQYKCEYDDNGAIGKRYRRQDEIGTPFCITFDQQSVEEYHANSESVTVTPRDRDTMEQTRILLKELYFSFL